MSNISHPPHYSWHPSGVQCNKIVQEFPYNVGVAMAYCWRHQHKGAAIDDLKKARQHLLFEIQRLEAAEQREAHAGGGAASGGPGCDYCLKPQCEC